MKTFADDELQNIRMPILTGSDDMHEEQDFEPIVVFNGKVLCEYLYK